MESTITVKELEDRIKDLFDAKEEWKVAKQHQTELDSKVKEIKAEVGVMLDKLDLDKYVAKSGVITKVERVNYRLKQDDESRAAFFNYLKEKDVYDQMIGVNSRTLQSFVTQEVALAELDEDFDFLPNGVEASEIYVDYKMTKK